MATPTIQLKNHRIEHEGVGWRGSGNRPGHMRVYRIRGDINQMPLLREALDLYVATLSLRSVH